MFKFNMCETCGQIAQTACECSSPPRFYCTTHIFEHIKSGGSHPFREALLSLSSEQASDLRRASNDYLKDSIQRAVHRRNTKIEDLFRQLKEAEEECSREIETILKEHCTIEEICVFKSLPVICDIPILSSLASLRASSAFSYQEVSEKLLFLRSSLPSLLYLPSLSSSLQSPSPPRWELLKQFQPHGESIQSLAVSDCENYLASGSEDNTIKIWDLETLQCVYTLSGHAGWVKSLTFWQNKLISGSEDKTIKIWEEDRCIETLSLHSDGVNTVCISSSKGLLASGGDDKKVLVYSLDKKKTLHSLTQSGETNSVVFSPTGNHIASASLDRTINVWKTDTGEISKILRGHSKPVICVCFLGNFLLSSSCDKSIKIWDIMKEEAVMTLKEHSSAVVRVEGNEDILVSLGQENSLRVWDRRSGECIQNLEGHGDYSQTNGWVQMNLKILKKGDYIVSGGGGDKEMKIFKRVR